MKKIFLITIVALLFVGCSKEEGSSGSTALVTPVITKIEFTTQTSAQVHFSTAAEVFEIEITDQNGDVTLQKGSASPVSISTPRGEVLIIKARAAKTGSTSTSDYSAEMEVLASVNKDRGLDRIDLMKTLNKMRSEGLESNGKTYSKVPKLIWEDRMEQVSFLHATDMYDNSLSGGKGSDGRSYGDRLKDANLVCSSYRELIVKGPSSLEVALNIFKDNSAYCDVMMSSSYSSLGGAMVQNNWVIDFADL